jgi:hypothetical protein
VLKVAENTDFTRPINLAVRMLRLLPEPPQRLFDVLSDAWRSLPREPGPKQVFLALALGELAAEEARAVQVLARTDADAAERSLKSLLAEAGAWRTEERPDLAAAALSIAFGLDAVQSWARGEGDPETTNIMRMTFGERRGKLQFAVKRLYQVVKRSLDTV